MSIPLRPFGRHVDQTVSARALGGYHIGQMTSAREAVQLVHAAIDAGVTFMDNAWEYNEHESEIRMGRAIADRRDRVFLMTKVCTHGRDAKVAMRQLHESLKRLRTDYLDLWQVHECVYENDPDRHFAKGGVVEALDRAKREGKVRFVGFTGHKSPDITCGCCRSGIRSIRVRCRSTCSTRPSAVSSSACCRRCGGRALHRSA
jgi:aryl-alcohol dehydrogenase-like predicted oxidoreductase